jgi:hypothetical protein
MMLAFSAFLTTTSHPDTNPGYSAANQDEENRAEPSLANEKPPVGK